MEPTSVVFQQAADVGMSHCTLLRHVLSRACVRAGLPPIPPPIVQDVTETNLVGTGQLNCHHYMGDAVCMCGQVHAKYMLCFKAATFSQCGKMQLQIVYGMCNTA